MTQPAAAPIRKGEYQYGFRKPDRSVVRTQPGLTRRTVEEISHYKNEPSWMRDFRLRALEYYERRPIPTWGADLTGLDPATITYYARPSDVQGRTWEDVPKEVLETFDALGIPEAEKRYLAGVGAQYDSEVVYHNMHESLKKQGVLFCDPETAIREYPDLVREYFGTIIPPNDNKYAALNSAVWSGGSFVYVPKGVHVDLPLQAYFRINAERMGQFERTLIIADEGSFVHYIEGCTAPVYTTNSLHSAVVEIVIKAGARVRYTTVQNWSKNVYNLVTKRAHAYREATMEWVDGNLGSQVTMKYPSVHLLEPGARGEVLSLAFAGDGQHQDAGGKMIHRAPYTSSIITSKSVSQGTGRTSYRGRVDVLNGAHHTKSNVVCDALLLDPASRSDTYPTMNILEPNVSIGHEATVSKVGAEQLFYLMSRGLTEGEAMTMVVSGFIEPIVKQLPMEFAVELNRLIEMEMSGSVG